MGKLVTPHFPTIADLLAAFCFIPVAACNLSSRFSSVLLLLSCNVGKAEVLLLSLEANVEDPLIAILDGSMALR